MPNQKEVFLKKKDAFFIVDSTLGISFLCFLTVPTIVVFSSFRVSASLTFVKKLSVTLYPFEIWFEKGKTHISEKIIFLRNGSFPKLVFHCKYFDFESANSQNFIPNLSGLLVCIG